MMKCIFDMQISIIVFYNLLLSFWVCITRHGQSTQNERFAYLCNFSRKIRVMKLIFSLEIDMKVTCKLTVSLWVCESRHAQSTQNNKFALSLEYLKKNMKDEVDFWPADKRQRVISYQFNK